MAQQVLPSGTVTFLFTDIEGSTRRWEQGRGPMSGALARHDALLRSAIDDHGGAVFKTIGDAFCAAFERPEDALAAALGGQRALAAESWGDAGPIRARMALHTGTAEERGGDYFGPTVNRVARLLAVGHGGQILLSLATYDLVRDVLPGGVVLRDLGEHRLKDLQRPERVYQLVASGLPADFPALNSLDARPNNLPPQLTPFVGRERELAAVRTLLLRDEVRLLTLTGPGGTGKTRLALHVAADVAEAFPDGVFLVELAAIRDPSLVAPAIARALGVREAPGQTVEEGLREFLRSKRLLLVLDNFEQVEAAAPLVPDLLRAASNMETLVTSRVALRVSGEQEFAVPPLELPDRVPPSAERLVDYEAVRLFVERARAVKPDFAVTDVNALACAEICRRLDGLPLAIELAATRLRLLPPQALLGQLARSLSLLTEGRRDLPRRQQTLRDAIAWSHDLLTPDERALFRRLAAFAGGFTLEAAEAVCGGGQGGRGAGGQTTDLLPPSVLDLLAALVDESLVRQVDGPGGETRFAMFQTILEFAAEQLAAGGEETDIRRAHAEFFAVLVERAAPELTGADQLAWLDRLDAEHDNLRAALTWAIARADTSLAQRIAGSLWRFWWVRGHVAEGDRWYGRVLALGDETPSSARARTLFGAGAMAEHLGDYDRAPALYRAAAEAARAVDNRLMLGLATEALGVVAQDQGHYDEAVELHNQARAIFAEVGYRRGLASTAHNLGSIGYYRGDVAEAEAKYTETLELVRALGDKRATAMLLGNLGVLAAARGDFGRAKRLQEETVALTREAKDDLGTATALLNLGEDEQQLGDLDRAADLVGQALAIFEELGALRQAADALGSLGRIAQARSDRAGAVRHLTRALELAHGCHDAAGTADILESLGVEASALGDPRLGARLLGAADALDTAIGAERPPAEVAEYESGVAAVRSAAGQAAFDTAWAEGATAPLDEVVAAAMTISSLATTPQSTCAASHSQPSPSPPSTPPSS